MTINKRQWPISLWDFALDFYSEDQVADVCVRLQDEHGVNVCVLIAQAWLDRKGVALGQPRLAALLQVVEGWTAQVVEPMRLLRRALKTPISGFTQDDLQEDIRRLIKQAELLAERKLLLEMEQWLQGDLSPSSVKTNNLRTYLQGKCVAVETIYFLDGI
jgi:uncharacterized protein (TIGR02444 family)